MALSAVAVIMAFPWKCSLNVKTEPSIVYIGEGKLQVHTISPSTLSFLSQVSCNIAECGLVSGIVIVSFGARGRTWIVAEPGSSSSTTSTILPKSYPAYKGISAEST